MRLSTSNIDLFSQRKDLFRISSHLCPHSNTHSIKSKQLYQARGHVWVTIIQLVNHHPSFHASFFTYVNDGVWSRAHHQPPQLNYPPGTSIRFVILVSAEEEEARSRKSYFQESEFSWLDFWLTGKCLYSEMHYPLLLNVWLFSRATI